MVMGALRASRPGLTGAPADAAPPPPMDSRSRTHLICTTSAWVDTSAPRLWELLADAPHWPLWWSAVARCDVATPRPRHALLAGRWRLALGWPLHLVVSTLASQPQEWLTWRLQGDLDGQATFMLQPAGGAPAGLDLTCRCELRGPAPGWWRGSAALERRAGGLLLALARDLGRALQCRTEVLGHWQGSRWRG